MENTFNEQFAITLQQQNIALTAEVLQHMNKCLELNNTIQYYQTQVQQLDTIKQQLITTNQQNQHTIDQLNTDLQQLRMQHEAFTQQHQNCTPREEQIQPANEFAVIKRKYDQLKQTHDNHTTTCIQSLFNFRADRGGTDYQELSPDAKQKRKNKIKKYITSCMTRIPLIESSEITLMLTGATYNFKLDNTNSTLSPKPIDTAVLDKYLAVKDQFTISDAAFHELHMIKEPIPPINQLTARRRETNTVMAIQQSDQVTIKVNLGL